MPQFTLNEILGGGQTETRQPRPMTLDEIAPEETAPSPIRRFVGGAAQEVKNIVRMPYEVAKAVLPERETGYIPGAGIARKFIVEPATEMFRAARERFREGRYPEAAGYAGAGLLPMLGPAAASIGEQAGEGDIAGAAGRAVVLGGLPLVPRGIKALRGKKPSKVAPVLPAPEVPVRPSLQPKTPIAAPKPQFTAEEILNKGDLRGGAQRLRERAAEVKKPYATEEEAFQGRMMGQADAIGKQIDAALEPLLTKPAKMTVEAGAETFERGTIPKRMQEEFFGTERPPFESQYARKISMEEVDRSRVALEAARQSAEPWLKQLLGTADETATMTARIVVKQLNDAAKVFKEIGTLSGRMLQMRQRSAEITARGRGLEEAADIVGFEKLATTREGLIAQTQALLDMSKTLLQGNKIIRMRDPITTGLVKAVKEGRWKDAGGYAIDQFRLNLFSIGSWTLDMIGNASELGAQGTGALGHDIVYAARTGEVSFPGIQGFGRAVNTRWRNRFSPMDKTIEEAFGQTVGGELVPGVRPSTRARLKQRGAFTYRSTPASAALDIIQGTPLYLKGAMDIGAKRLSATATTWREAIKAADDAGVKGVGREAFYENYFKNLPKETQEMAIAEGNKAGFNRPLSMTEEAIARNPWVKLLAMGFPRWGFQFTRWAGEMLGYNRELFGKIKSGTVMPEEIGSYLAKTATGYGGLMLLDQMLYDRTDFNTAEFVTEDGNRVRLGSREPVMSGLWFLAMIKGDWEKASQALKFVSAPGAEVIANLKERRGFGGLLGGFLTSMAQAVENPQNDPQALKRELENTLNRAIPGQAILGTLAGIIDPTYREGIGAGLPGVSTQLPARPSRTTGEPFRPRQRLTLPGIGELGPSVPAIRGTPIPGFARQLDPVEKLLTRYGASVYRGLRTPIAGFPPGEAPRENRREWEVEFGRKRAELLTPLYEKMKNGELDKYDDETVLKIIKARDSQAAKWATATINEKYGTPAKLPRRPTVRELAGPTIYRERLQPPPTP